MWHIYNLIQKGDQLKASTVRYKNLFINSYIILNFFFFFFFFFFFLHFFFFFFFFFFLFIMNKSILFLLLLFLFIHLFNWVKVNYETFH